ncbi:kinesin heavy chain [Glomus cerebriforme]|uniref:Kinesin heavy chain n=1 Tax=Glomus cerebriforme TaxID=658196 RepID=A0A397S4R1_9GLOM|nr:kinesin heavy chain [Glomus cerebriforme]
MGDFNKNNIRVVCRFRPQNSYEIKEGGVSIIDYDNNSNSCHLEGKESQESFTFDQIFRPETQQKLFFDESIKPIVDDVIEGYNGTVFAYGQTGSGKTYTMMGDIDNEELKGLIPRILEQIFDKITSSPSTIEFTVKVSYMEIYMEKIRDLLNPQNDNLSIHEEKNRGVYVKDLLEVYVNSTQKVYDVMKCGGNSRIVAYTNMNAESSRSHSIFVITINQKNLNDGSIKNSKLSLVDLAGFENVSKTGASGQILEEAKKINKSLSALGIVINALIDGKSTHIPYRDSKLTRILQESLGGNSRTILIINCSPSSFNETETLSTLKFGMRVKSIKNKARINAEFNLVELKTLLEKAKNEAICFQQYILALESEVDIWRAGNTVPKEKWASMDKVTSSTSDNFAIKAVKKDIDSQSGTSATILEKYDQEEFLKQENELTDQITKKEVLISQEKLLDEMKHENVFYKLQEDTIIQENKQMESRLNELKVQLEKVIYENKEDAITMDSLREDNSELSSELELLKKTLSELRLSHKKVYKEQKKQEKMAVMLAELDSSGVISKKEQQIEDSLLKFEKIFHDNSSPSIMKDIQCGLSNSKNLISQHEQTISKLNHENEHLTKKIDELEIRSTTLELEYEELLDKTIVGETVNNNINIIETIAKLRGKLESQFDAKKVQQKEIDELKQELEKKNKELHKLNNGLVDLKKINEELQTVINDKEIKSGGEQKNVAEKEKDLERIRKTMAQQLADFNIIKKALMCDLHNCCEKVVELEISLDETREQYNKVICNSNNKVQQKKMAFLEKNLEQLTNIQNQLVGQNSTLKKEVAIAERKVLIRNERIQVLEALLQDAQESLCTQNQKFEAQLQAVQKCLG